MRASTNIALKERKTVVLDNFRGVDFSSSPLQIKNYHAAEMENLISIDGVNQKRPGWQELVFAKDQIASEGPRRVNGIFGLDEGMLLHIGNNLYFANSNKRTLLQTDLPNAPSQAFYKDDKCYLITGKGIFVCQKGSDGQYLLEPIENNAYIPTTTISINAESKSGDSVRSSLDDINLLTAWRKNSLLGTELSVMEIDTENGKEYRLSSSEWVLDGAADISASITVEILLDSNREQEPLILKKSGVDGKLRLAEGSTYDGAVEIENRYVDLSKEGTLHWWNVYIPEGGIYVADDFPIGTLLKQKIISQTDGTTSYIYARVVKIEIDSEYEGNSRDAKTYTFVPVDYDDLYGSIINYGENSNTRLRLNINTKPSVGGADNITIKFKCPQYIELGQKNPIPTFEQKNMITLCSFGVLFGAEGGRDRLFLSGNPFYPNIDFWSDVDDFTYFPANNYAKVGSENTSISGYAKLTDNTLAIFKSQNTRRASDKTAESYVYYRTGVNNISTDEEGNLKNFSTIFKLREGAIGEELASRHSIVNLSGDVLMLSTNGVYGLIRSDNLNSMEYNAIERSSLVSASIRKYNATDYISSESCYVEPYIGGIDMIAASWNPQLNRCVAVVYKNRYYLAFPNENNYPCFVADARYKTSGGSSSYGYEWWKWTNVPAVTWAVIDDRLYFGTSDGKICLFDNESQVTKYCDSTALNLLPGKILLKTLNATDYNGTPMYLEGATDGATVRLVNCAEVLGKVSTVKNQRFYVSAEIIQKIYVGQKIRFKGIAFGDNVEYEVVDVDYYENSFQLKYGATVMLYTNHVMYSPIDFDVYVKGTPSNCTLHRAPPTDNNIDEAYMQPMKIIDLSQSEERISFGEIRFHKNIAALWTSGTLDLGTNAYSKTLLRLVLGVGDACGKGLHFGYQTRNSDVWRGARGVGHFAFDSLDFENFSFDKDFTTSFAIKCNERNFNYIRFRLMSNSDGNFAVNSITAIYKINKQNLGVR